MKTYILHLTQFLNFYIEWINFFVKSKYNAKTVYLYFYVYKNNVYYKYSENLKLLW
jgi:hypothetical protein